MICPKCRRETSTIMPPGFVCPECVIKDQRKQIEELDTAIQILLRAMDSSHDSKEFGAWKFVRDKYYKAPFGRKGTKERVDG